MGCSQIGIVDKKRGKKDVIAKLDGKNEIL
jgi:hypothetical protein